MEYFKNDALDKIQTFRRCNSEPPLVGRLTASSSQQSNSSAHSLQDIKSNHQKKMAQKLSPGGRAGTVVRSSTFPLLPTLNKPKNGHQVVICSENAENHKETAFPLFSNLGYNGREIILNQRGLLQARKYDLKSRYTIDAMKVPVMKKQPTSNPLRKRVQEINDVVDKDLNGNNVLDDSDELLSDLHCPFSGHQSTIRRLSVITEKSNFSRTSNKTALFDLEDENEANRSILPSVEKNRVNKRPSYLEKNSRKLQEHVKMTEKQFNALESKATLLSSWFKTLEMEG